MPTTTIAATPKSAQPTQSIQSGDQSVMPKESRSPLQDAYIQEACTSGARVAIYLVNGIRLVGRIISSDVYVLTLEQNGTQVVYKHSISTVVPYSESEARVQRPPRPHSA